MSELVYLLITNSEELGSALEWRQNCPNSRADPTFPCFRWAEAGAEDVEIVDYH